VVEERFKLTSKQEEGLNMKIKFVKVGGFKDLFLNADQWDDKIGIYVWLSNWKNRITLEYIGKATSISLARRQLDHYQGYLSLNYSLRAEFRASKKPWIYGGKYNRDFYSIHTDPNESEILRAEMMAYANSITIYFAHFREEEISEIPNIERNLIYKYRPEENKQFKKTPPPQRKRVDCTPVGDLNLEQLQKHKK
jgi:hypothetical protein